MRERRNIPPSSEEQSDPMARKKEYIAMVKTNMISKLIKNCDAVLARFAMLEGVSGTQLNRRIRTSKRPC